MGQYLNYQIMIEITTHEKIDKINGVLCEKLEDISAFVKNIGDQIDKDATIIDMKFQLI